MLNHFIGVVPVTNLAQSSCLRMALAATLLAGAAQAALAEKSTDFTTDPEPNAPAVVASVKKEAPIKVWGVPTTSTEVVAGQNQPPMLQSNSEELLRTAQVKYESIIAQGGFPVVPCGSYKKGSTGSGVGTLNRRLNMEGYLRVEGTQGQYAELYTSATQAGIARFQRNHGLIVSGKVDKATLAELNVSAQDRLRAISANIPRLATYELGLGDRYVVVNVPAQQIETVSGGRVYARHNAIVGRPARPTPVVMAPLQLVRFNPYWNAPVSIVEKDIIPKLQGGNQYLEDMNIKIFDHGDTTKEVDPSKLNFSQIVPDDYLFRQEPGPHNAMATAKVEFKSPFGIYMHDTPEQQMFNADNRFFSSGCIRVQNMPKFVEWVLNGQDGFGEAKIHSMSETLERLDEPIQNPPQLRVAYLTAWPAAGGTVAFRKDIYELDGSGFTLGQPMPVGEMSPDGKRYVLKPLPRLAPDADAPTGFGLFASRQSVPAKRVPLFGVSKPEKASFVTPPARSLAAVPSVKAKPASASSVDANAPKGLFDWTAYRKKQSAEAKLPKKKLKPKPDAKLTDAKAPPPKKLDCKVATNGKPPAACPVPTKG